MEVEYLWTWERLDTRLSKQYDYSRNFFHHILERKGILVNGTVKKKSYRLQNGDKVFIDNLERYLSPAMFEESPFCEIPIVYEEEDYLILNKPKGVLSHPNSIRDLKTPSVVWFLFHYFQDLPSYGNFIRAWLIHRLDKDTDGLMIIAKTEEGLKHFKNLFQEKSENASIQEKESVPLQKFYRAEVFATPKGEIFLETIKDKLPYYIQETVKAKVPNFIPKMGITKIEKFSEIKREKSWLRIKVFLQILTWRTHQIRYHLSEKGLPIVWDYLYGEESNEPLQLTAYKIQYLNLNGEMKVIEI